MIRKYLILYFCLASSNAWANCSWNYERLANHFASYGKNAEAKFSVLLNQKNTKLEQYSSPFLTQYFSGAMNSALIGEGKMFASDQISDGQRFSGSPYFRGQLQIKRGEITVKLPYPYGKQTLSRTYCYASSYGYFFEGVIESDQPTTIVAITVAHGRRN